METSDPDPLLPFLVPAPNPIPARSAPSLTSQLHPALDPPSPTPDLHVDGPQATPHHQHSEPETNTAEHHSPPPTPGSLPEVEINPFPASPTEIDRELKEQAWALLPDLARDLHKLKDPRLQSEAEELAINVQPASLTALAPTSPSSSLVQATEKGAQSGYTPLPSPTTEETEEEELLD